MKKTDLTNDNFFILAAKNYKMIVIDEKEFKSDLGLINKFLSRIKKYSKCGEFSVRKMINVIITASNCFGQEFVVKSLFLKSETEYHSIIVTFLNEFGFINDEVYVNGNLNIRISDFLVDLQMKNKIQEEMRDYL